MSILKIRKYGDPVLTERAREIEKIDGKIKNLIKNMLETMYDIPGIGLAANQVGSLARVFVCDVGEGPLVFINPEIVKTKGVVEEEEGCLSVPGVTVPVKRAKEVTLKARGLDGQPVRLVAKELLARVLQHEMDHLDGNVILARTDRENRKRALNELSNADRKD